MKVFLIRHGETVDNVAGVYAGVRDSALTNHGVLQAQRLGQHFADTDVKVSHIFSSDLQRAFKTAEAIRLAQARSGQSSSTPSLEVTKLKVLREQDFGFYEGKAFFERPSSSNKTGKEAHLEAHRNDPGFQDVEPRESMIARCNKFVDDHLLDIIDATEQDRVVAVVAHGIILSHLWRAILHRFPPKSVSVALGAVAADRALVLEHLGGWSNTGYLELELLQIPTPNEAESSISSVVPPSDETSLQVTTSARRDLVDLKLVNMFLVVKAVNSLVHLKGVKKTRGGIGSSKHDEGQKTIESFFKKRKIG